MDGYRLINITKVFKKHGLIKSGKDDLKAQAPYWAKMLDLDYESGNGFEYAQSLAFVKELGYKVYRNDNGCHKLVYEEKKGIRMDKKSRLEQECCNTCKHQKQLVKFDYSKGGCEHTDMSDYACDLFGSEGYIVWMVGTDGVGQCECWEARK